MNNYTKILFDLAQLDIDAVNAYDQALKNIDDKEIYNRLLSFRNDHIQHINDLSSLLIKYGETPPHSADFKGYLIESFTALRSLTGTTGALKAMETNEVITTKKYAEALKQPDLPWDIRRIIEENYHDEEYHLQFIKEVMTLVAAA